jgi:ATP-dependent Clp protease ATP-binding subunit ClpA
LQLLDRFTETAKLLITDAREKAENQNHGNIYNEHLLQTFVNKKACFAYRLIMEHIPFPEFVMLELESRLKNLSENKEDITFDEFCKKSFERAFLITEKLEHKGISTGSLLLGMLQSEAPKTAPMLRSWGLNLKKLMTVIRAEGDPGTDETALSRLDKKIARQINRMNVLSKDAQNIISHAQELAKSVNNADINPYHILLSFVFLASRNVISVSPLDADSFNLQAVKESVSSNLKGQNPYSEDKFLFEYEVHKVFNIAAMEAFQFGRSEITPNEIALGLLQVIPNEAAEGLGGDYYSLRWGIIDQVATETHRHGIVPEKQLLSIPQISLRRYNADQNIVILIPEKRAREWKVMALDVNDDVLTVAMFDPDDDVLKQKIEDFTGLKIAPIKADEKDLSAAFRINY